MTVFIDIWQDGGHRDRSLIIGTQPSSKDRMTLLSKKRYNLFDVPANNDADSLFIPPNVYTAVGTEAINMIS